MRSKYLLPLQLQEKVFQVLSHNNSIFPIYEDDEPNTDCLVGGNVDNYQQNVE